MLVTDTHVFFWGGVFSNFYRINNKIGQTSERLFMLGKAKLFKDNVTYDKIFACKDPLECKRLGRTVKNFDNAIWANNRYDCMMEALTWKYDASKEFRQLLRECGTKTIVEASPDDRIWGIGYYDHEAMEHQSSWGLNLLGQCLMQIKEENEL